MFPSRAQPHQNQNPSMRKRERACMCVRVSGSEGIWPQARANVSMCGVYSSGFIFDAAIRNLYNSGFASVPG